MVNVILNGAVMTSRAEAHAEIARVLELPDYYGANLDALWDVLGDLEGEITLIHADALRGFLGLYGEKLLKTLQEAHCPPRLMITIR